MLPSDMHWLNGLDNFVIGSLPPEMNADRLSARDSHRS